jgi:hypothetical protein
VRMEGWRQRRPGSNGKTPDKKKKNRLDTNRPSHGRTGKLFFRKQPKMLSLAATKSKKPRLQILSRFQSLTHLYLEGQQQGIEILYELKKLEDVTLRSITTEGLDYISGYRSSKLRLACVGHARRRDTRVGGY